MQAIHASPQSIRKMSSQEFMIPEYQRPYSWGQDECDQLWNDLSDFLEGHLAENDNAQGQYFLGSIVVHPAPENENMWMIIDGQQRLTTLLILLKALLNRASSYTVLEKVIYKEDTTTGEAKRDNPRLESKVQGTTDRDALQQVLTGTHSNLPKKNLFRANYERLDDYLKDWWNNKTSEQCKKIVDVLLNRVALLPIECASSDEALTLFEIINNRGKPLGDADIFKAKIYNAVPESKRNNFISRWNAMAAPEESSEKGDSREKLFRIYMHISRASKDEYGKEGNLREYITKHHLRDPAKLSSNWDELMSTLETCHWVSKNPSSDNKDQVAKEKIYWEILKQCPNTYWSYPLHVFLQKHMQKRDHDYYLPENMWEKYIALMEDTIRYFFIKAVVHNAVNAVKDVTYRVCADIAQGRDYTKHYREGAQGAQKDRGDFERKLTNSDVGKCLKGIVYLVAYLNPKQDYVKYGDAVSEKNEIEHILPKKWQNYDKWDETSWKENLNRIGNLVPLKKELNIRASNEFFPRKQEEYRKSNIQDALDLAEKNPAVWYPGDVEKRQEESLERLLEFFRELSDK